MAKARLSKYSNLLSTSSITNSGYLNTTLDDLEKDERFQETAERFLSSVGERSDDIFEHLRDSDYNLYSGFSRAMESKKWTQQQQRDYRYLRGRFDNADMGSFKQYLSATKNIGYDIATDPLAIAAVLLSPITGGIPIAARTILTKGATQGLKNLSKAQVETAITKFPIAEAKKLGAKQIGKVAGYTAVEGATWTGLDNHFRQETELNTQLRQLYSNPELVGSTAIGALFGGLIGAGTQAGRLYYSQLADKFSDGRYIFNNDLIYNLRRKKDVVLASTIGKPTAVLNNIAAYSSVADELRKLFRYDAGKTFTSRTRSRLDWSYGELVDFRRGDYKMLYEGIIAPLYKTGRMNPAYEEAIIKVMRGDKLDDVATDIGLNVQEKDIVRNIVGDQTTGLRGFFNKILDDAKEVGIPVNKVDDYFPRSWNRKAIEKNEDGFIDLLVSKGVIETRKEAKDVVSGMLNKNNELFSSHTNLITQKRIFKDLKDNDFTEFLNNGLHDVSLKYFLEAARVIERKAAFGLEKPFTITRVKSKTKEKTKKLEAKRKYGEREATPEELVTTKTKEDILTLKSQTPEEEFIERWLDPIDEQMKKSIRKKGLTRDEKRRILNVYKSVTGQVDYWDTAGIQQVYDATKLSQAMAHLPLATVSSLTEIVIPFTRSTPTKTTKELLKSMKGYHKHITEDLRTILRDKHGMKEPEMIKEMQSVFLAVDEAVADRIESLAGEGIQTEWVKKGGRMFFKANLLTDWTRFVQLTSFNIGKDIVNTNLTKLNKAIKGGKTLEGISRGKLGRYKEELFELGVDIEKGLKWIDDGAKITDEFYTKDLMRSAGRFTNEVILNPSREKALKPVIQSNPKADILFQFLGYPTAFSNTVMKNAARSLIRNPVANSPRILVGGMIMTQLAMFLNDWRSTPEQRKLIESDQEEILKGLQRVGALGPMEHAYRYAESLAYTKSPLTSIGLLGGPILEDVVGTLSYRRGLAQNLVRNLPGYGARGLMENLTGIKAYSALLEGSKSFDKALLQTAGITKPPKTGLEIDTSIRYAEGGRVGYAEGDEITVESIRPDSIFEPKVDVVGTTDDPKERVNPKTGEPYTAIYKKPRVGLVAGGEVEEEEEEDESLVNKEETWIDQKLKSFEGPESKEDGAYIKRLLKTFWTRNEETDPVNLRTLKYFLKGKGKGTSADNPVDLTHFWKEDDIEAMKRAMIRQNYTQEDWNKLAYNPKDTWGMEDIFAVNILDQEKDVVGYDHHDSMTGDYLTSGYKYYGNIWDDPAQRVQTTVGRIRPKRNQEGTWILKDQFDFTTGAAGHPDDPDAQRAFGSDYLKLRTWMMKLTDLRPDLHFQITIPKEFNPTDPKLKEKLLQEDLEYNTRWREKYYNTSFGEDRENFSLINAEDNETEKQMGKLGFTEGGEE